MRLISKTTWDKFDPTEQKEIRELYSALTNALKQEQIGSEEHLRLSSIQDCYISLFGKENLHPQLTYEDVVKELFPKLREGVVRVEIPTFSKKEAEKLIAIGKLLATAKFLNGNWKPDWEDDTEPKWYLCDIPGKKPIPCFTVQNNSCIVYFRTQEKAEKAIEILGKDVIRLALTTEY
ncbi:MAG: hypothetical protein J1E16_04285 [Muribaculaceae bacterium]|nr:hypothetical protein [Muribaculaceae bacterium]